MAKLVSAADLKSADASLAGSSPAGRTITITTTCHCHVYGLCFALANALVRHSPQLLRPCAPSLSKRLQKRRASQYCAPDQHRKRFRSLPIEIQTPASNSAAFFLSVCLTLTAQQDRDDHHDHQRRKHHRPCCIGECRGAAFAHQGVDRGKKSAQRLAGAGGRRHQGRPAALGSGHARHCASVVGRAEPGCHRRMEQIQHAVEGRAGAHAKQMGTAPAMARSTAMSGLLHRRHGGGRRQDVGRLNHWALK